MRTYTLQQNNTPVVELEDFDEILTAAADRFSQQKDLRPASLTVFDDQGMAVAVFTNRRILGNFVKQQWGGRKGDDAIAVESVEFDATNAILCMSLEDIQALEDNRESTDAIGQMHVQWDGPHEVTIEESILSYFGVEDLELLSQDILAFATTQGNPTIPVSDKVTLTIDVYVSMPLPDTENERNEALSAFTENLDYEIRSNTPGIVVCSTKITDC